MSTHIYTHVSITNCRSSAYVQIIMWDIRKGRSAAHQLGGYGPAKHPILAIINMRKALAAIPGLTLQTPVPNSQLTHLLLDPLNDTRAGYTFACGWQGTALATFTTYTPDKIVDLPLCPGRGCLSSAICMPAVDSRIDCKHHLFTACADTLTAWATSLLMW